MAFFIPKHNPFNISIFYSRLIINICQRSISSVKYMADQTIIEQHLKQLRNHAKTTAAGCYHFDKHMIHTYGLTINQDYYITAYPGAVQGFLNEI